MASTTALNIFIGERIREARNTKGVSLQNVGVTVKRSYQQIQRYEKGMYEIPSSILFRIAKYLNVPISSFFPKRRSKKL